MTERITYSAIVTYHRPETDKQKALRIALKKPQPTFSFIVERVESQPQGFDNEKINAR